MDEIKKEISELRENVAVLVNAIDDIKKSEMRLKQENSDLRNEIQNQKEKISFLDEKNKMVNLASTIEPEEKAQMKEKIRDLVREIDGCIAMLNN